MNILNTMCITLAGTALLASLASAQMPVRPGDSNLFGFAYEFAWRGEDITDAEVQAHGVTHRATYAWAPWEYLEFNVGIGAANYSTYNNHPTNFDGNWQFSPQAGVVLNTPAVADMLRLRGAFDYSWWQSEGNGITYSQHVLDPSVSLVWNTRRIDFEMGALWHMGYGTMEGTAKESDFSNVNTVRGFAALAARLPGDAFIRLYADASPQAEGWHGGPTETTLGITVGWQKIHRKEVRNEPELRHFPSVPNMRTQQDEMLNELHDGKKD